MNELMIFSHDCNPPWQTIISNFFNCANHISNINRIAVFKMHNAFMFI